MPMKKEELNGLTQERLKQLLRYEPKTGIFIWLKTRGCTAVKGSKAGWLVPTGYRKITVDWIGYEAHRLAFLYMTGEWPPELVDHKNLSRDDNRWTNLRLATHAQNKANQSVRCDNVAGMRGVTKRKLAFDARIMIKGKAIHLGCFPTAQEASAAYTVAAKNLYGEFHRA